VRERDTLCRIPRRPQLLRLPPRRDDPEEDYQEAQDALEEMQEEEEEEQELEEVEGGR